MMTCVVALFVRGARTFLEGRKPAAKRPDQVLKFAVLYKQNCAACHGEDGKEGAAISLANPVYLAVAGANIIREGYGQWGAG